MTRPPPPSSSAHLLRRIAGVLCIWAMLMVRETDGYSSNSHGAMSSTSATPRQQQEVGGGGVQSPSPSRRVSPLLQQQMASSLPRMMKQQPQLIPPNSKNNPSSSSSALQFQFAGGEDPWGVNTLLHPSLPQAAALGFAAVCFSQTKNEWKQKENLLPSAREQIAIPNSIESTGNRYEDQQRLLARWKAEANTSQRGEAVPFPEIASATFVPRSAPAVAKAWNPPAQTAPVANHPSYERSLKSSQEWVALREGWKKSPDQRGTFAQRRYQPSSAAASSSVPPSTSTTPAPPADNFYANKEIQTQPAQPAAAESVMPPPPPAPVQSYEGRVSTASGSKKSYSMTKLSKTAKPFSSGGVSYLESMSSSSGTASSAGALGAPQAAPLAPPPASPPAPVAAPYQSGFTSSSNTATPPSYASGSSQQRQ